MDEVPLPSLYGAAELKFFIRKNTYRGAIYALIILLLFLLFNIIQGQVERAALDVKVAPIVKMSIEDLPPPDADQADLPPPPEVVINTGPAARAGNPIPVPDAQIAPDMKEFATIDVADRASSQGGDGIDAGGFAGNIDWNKTETKVETLKEKEPDPDDFIAVEKDPVIDIKKLQGLVIYPEMAKKAGIEGTVYVRALVDKNGKISKAIIESSDNKALDPAAIKAMMDYGYATPAVNGGQPVTCWITVPIKFQLR